MRLLNLTEFKALVLESESYDEYQKNISENIKYHIENDLSISESIFRIGSDSYLDMINEMRSLHEQGKIIVSEDDKFILERLQTGKKGTYSHDGSKKTVSLDDPHLRGKNEPTKNLYIVYRPHPKGEKDKDTGLVKAVALGFGEDTGAGNPDVRQKHQDPGKRASFLARHNCDTVKDMYSASWWSCNIHKFYKQLGLKSNEPW